MPAPDDVNSTDMYDRFGPEPLMERTSEIRAKLMQTVENPQNAPGWFGVLIPAIATALALRAVRRFL